VTAHFPTGAAKHVFSHKPIIQLPGAYTFIKPVYLPAGSKLRLSITYWNDPMNQGIVYPRRSSVRIGPGRLDELGFVHVQYAVSSHRRTHSSE
jgi:hypothetical protein